MTTSPLRMQNPPSREAAAVTSGISNLRLLAGDESEMAASPPPLIAVSSAMQAVWHDLKQFAATRATVLLSGESGTGKEICAQLLHAWSPRASHPFVPVNCAALPDQLAESELFGHVEGAFTGAERSRAGSFQAAQLGTLFLDEISEMPLALQAKLLRVLEVGELQRLGSDQRHYVDVRVVAASNRDLRRAVERRRFRADLFYRINVLHIHIPPLRERPDDILPIAQMFLRQYRQEGTGCVEHLSSEVADFLVQYHWPGNVRELRNAMQRACIVCQSDTIQLTDLRLDDNSPRSTPPSDYRELSLQELERRAIVHALHKFHGNKTAAARHLGVTSRTLHNKLQRDASLRRAG